MKHQISNISFIDFASTWWSKESCYSAEEIAWVMEVLYSYKFKTKDEVKDKTRNIMIHCANNNIKSLFQLYNQFCEQDFIRPIHIRRETYHPKYFVTDKILKRLNLLEPSKQEVVVKGNLGKEFEGFM